eukprot:TRINITY_DN4154_c0_g1_i1.p1 TRINITY_DN4154_c0_g1~~TRINITY_DN4154_c0_g1_i1.p1  ORF type:complete len:620 (-),score=211.01 TRINITY_DN4154_c0_g1_i1:1519-3378(-)
MDLKQWGRKRFNSLVSSEKNSQFSLIYNIHSAPDHSSLIWLPNDSNLNSDSASEEQKVVRRTKSLLNLHSWDASDNHVRESTWIFIERIGEEKKREMKEEKRRKEIERMNSKRSDGTEKFLALTRGNALLPLNEVTSMKTKSRLLTLKNRERKDRLTMDFLVLKESAIEEKTEISKHESMNEENFKPGVNVELDSDGKIMTCTVDIAIDQMMDAPYLQLDGEWLKMMSLVHIYFMSNEEYLNRLLKHFDQFKLERRQALDAIITWLQSAPSDFRFGMSGEESEMNEIAAKLKDYFHRSREVKLKEVVKENLNQIYARNSNHYSEYTGIGGSSTQSCGSPSIMKRVRRVVSFTSGNFPKMNAVLDFKTSELAEQFALKEHKMFCSIRLDELIEDRWSKKGSLLASNVKTYINYFNKVSNWVSTQIVSSTQEKTRITYISKFIRLASKCYNIDNFNTSMEIFIGLSSGPVQNLTKSWKKVPKKYKRIFTNLSEIFQPDGNHKNFRSILKNKTSLPCNPYLGLHLRDLSLIEMHNPTTVRGRINFLKMRMIWKIFDRIQKDQTVPYPFEENQSIQHQLDQLNVVDNAELWNRSSLCEQGIQQQQRRSTIGEISISNEEKTES